MATLVEDVVQGGAASLGANGATATRVFIIKGLGGNPKDRLLRALTSSGIPSRADRHPGDPFLPVDEITAEPVGGDTDTIRVTVNYRLPTGAGGDFGLPNLDPVPAIEVTATVQNVQTNMDAFGNPIIVEYISTDDASQTSTVIKQPGFIEFNQPMVVFRYNRLEPGDQKPPVGEKAKRFIGKTNDRPIFGDPLNSWLCTDLAARSEDNGQTYHVLYEFVRAPERRYVNRVRGKSKRNEVITATTTTWDTIVAYIDPATGRPPPDVSFENGGLQQVAVYRTENFWELGI